MWWFITHAAVAEYRFDVWTTDSGLPQNSISAILQSREGYLWLATSDGVVRFDGVRFVVFDKLNTPFRHNLVSVLIEARDGALWIGTKGGGVYQQFHGTMAQAAGNRQQRARRDVVSRIRLAAGILHGSGNPAVLR